MKTYTWIMTIALEGEQWERAGGPYTSLDKATREAEAEAEAGKVAQTGGEVLSSEVHKHSAASKPELLRRVVRR